MSRLLFVGGLGFIFSLLLKLQDAINAILAMRILVQFVAQAIGVVLLRKRNGTAHLPFKMWLYPLPVVIFGGYLAVRIVLDGSGCFAGIVSGGMRDRSFLPI